MGGNGSGAKPSAEGVKLRTAIRRYRRDHPEASCVSIARRFKISRQLAHKILRSLGLATRGQISAATKGFYRFQAKVRGLRGKHAIAAALGITPASLWRYELPPDDPRHRDMPEEMRERYRKLVERKKP